MMNRPLALILARSAGVAILIGGCSTSGAPTALPSTAPAQAATPIATAHPAVTPSADPAIAGARDFLILRRAAPTADAAYEVVDTASRTTLMTLPDGAVSGDWRTLVTVSATGATTDVRVLGAEGGTLRTEIAVPGAWRLPAIGVEGRPGGVSEDGTILVLEEAGTPAPVSATSRTRLALVDTTGALAPRIVTLDGAFAYDALTPNGLSLYLIHHLAGADPGHYEVIRLAVPTGVLDQFAVVDKRNVDEQMNGYAVVQEAGPAGWFYTVYRGPDGAFVHALDTIDGVAFCIDLPGTAGEDATSGAAWGLALDPAATTLFAANPELGTVSAIDLADFSVRRTGKLSSAPTVELAKFETARPVGGRIAMSTDGKSMYVLGRHGLAVVRAADLATTARLGGDTAFRSVAAGTGGLVYAVDSDGRAVIVDPSGGPGVRVGTGSYASIVAVVPIP